MHLAAIYDLTADAESQRLSNVEGTSEAIKLSKSLKAGCFHLVSSIAAAGLYKGTFTEDMFDEATDMDNPYFWTKHESEGLVRKERKMAWRIYRPGMVVGHSETGQMDKIDGPYYFFDLINNVSKVERFGQVERFERFAIRVVIGVRVRVSHNITRSCRVFPTT